MMVLGIGLMWHIICPLAWLGFMMHMRRKRAARSLFPLMLLNEYGYHPMTHNFLVHALNVSKITCSKERHAHHLLGSMACPSYMEEMEDGSKGPCSGGWFWENVAWHIFFTHITPSLLLCIMLKWWSLDPTRPIGIRMEAYQCLFKFTNMGWRNFLHD